MSNVSNSSYQTTRRMPSETIIAYRAVSAASSTHGSYFHSGFAEDVDSCSAVTMGKEVTSLNSLSTQRGWICLPGGKANDPETSIAESDTGPKKESGEDPAWPGEAGADLRRMPTYRLSPDSRVCSGCSLQGCRHSGWLGHIFEHVRWIGQTRYRATGER